MAVVVKVKYEDTLRRFTAYTREDGNIDLNLDELRSKIYELFQFNLNTQFVITYVDEDNDIVTMANNEDLCDAFRQGLNPLRLQISLINQTNRGMEKHTQSLPTTPRNVSMSNDHVQPFDLRSVCSDETLKSLPEPVRKALMNFIRDCPVLTPSSISDFVQGMIKLASTNLPPFMKSQQVAGASNVAEATNNASHSNDAGEQGVGNVKSGLNDRAGPSTLPGGSFHGHVLKKNVHVGENLHRVFHKGVQCDGCGMNPIVGPRYKSTVKDNYDLCHSCFCESGEQDEYTKIERALYRHPRFARGRAFAEMGLSGNEACPFLKQRVGNPYYPFQSAPWKQHNKAHGKLDCRFVEDVTIFDGTQLAPGTEFTKIWRLRNNGTVPWPQYTQLVRVGGDDLGAGNAINLEIQEQGYPINEEIDAAVDFVAPMQPGRYVSYWRLMAPSGQKFGQRVWVLIQVEMQKEDLLPNLMESLLNLNDDDQKSPIQQKNMEKEIVGNVSAQGPQQEQRIDDNQMIFDSQDYLLIEGGHNPYNFYDKTVKELPLFFPDVGIDAPTQVQGIGAPTKVKGSSSMNTESMNSILGADTSFAKSVPVDYTSAGTTVVPASAPSLTASEVQFTLGRNAEDGTGIEQKLLHELEEMGFKHKGLNAEVLRKNNYDIQKTLDDLCGTADWDPILEELQEMGFHDTEMNKRLLMKNEGSVKRVVIDLLSAERDGVATLSPSKKAKQS